ncbi:MAG: Asp-tRNA(Asn)/Glu-tRNA(Gln) amidotransferase subunit GatB [Lachnospiraceae bacterium]|nr:Asp-tRNA(Asn)/Glu-tRNA(Gln) amidotransferase subunit GatB [Lachnospiraceae bacterium]
MSKQYETVIGLEVHVELATKTKIFCGCSTEFGGAPNTHTCPVCMGMPGTLPVMNRQVVEYAMAVGLATNCQIMSYCAFDRKNYFYPDNPQNYQISQLYRPICRDGYVEIQVGGKAKEDDTDVGLQTKQIRIHEIHMEEDAGKLIHDEEGNSLVDYNRAGVPLIEIVSEPDMRSAEEVIAYLEKLRMLIQYIGASDCKLQEGSMRADVNLSVREVGAKEFGIRTEMKNLNSFHSITNAIASERERQIRLLENGEEVVQETRRWDEDKEMSFAMRSKEDARDYRYFPEPDLMPVHIDADWVERVRNSLPEFREAKIARYKQTYDIPDYDIELITDSKHLADIFEATVELGAPAKKVSNWLMTETLRILKERNLDAEDIGFAPKNLAALIDMTQRQVINSTVAKEVFEVMFESDTDPVAYVEEKGLGMINDEGALLRTIEQVLEDNPKSVEDYYNGRKRAVGFLVGQAMKATGGKADPTSVRKLLEQKLQNSN